MKKVGNTPIANKNFKRLKKWENELNKCIRCGYCYELCPLYKTFSWESNTPRGKLIILHGLISGKINLTPEIAEKIFQCFYCEQCSDNCSAGVPVTEILTDARSDFIDAGLEVDGTTSKFKEDLCSACGMCISVCKYEALSFKEEEDGKKKVVVDKIKCKGCGSCIATCPSGVIFQKHGFEVSPYELKKKITGFLDNKETKLVVFCCNWSVFPGLQMSQNPILIKTSYGIIVTMCSGRVNPELVLDAFKKGAWGVLVSGCPPEECDHEGNYRARKRILLLKDLFRQINIEPERIRMGWFSRGESAKLNQAIKDFIKDLEELGPICKPSLINLW